MNERLKPGEALEDALARLQPIRGDAIIDFLCAVHGYEVVDVLGFDGATDLDSALLEWLTCVRPPSGAFGQTMDATMSYEATRRLRATAAKHLKAKKAEIENTHE